MHAYKKRHSMEIQSNLLIVYQPFPKTIIFELNPIIMARVLLFIGLCFLSSNSIFSQGFEWLNWSPVAGINTDYDEFNAYLAIQKDCKPSDLQFQ